MALTKKWLLCSLLVNRPVSLRCTSAAEVSVASIKEKVGPSGAKQRGSVGRRTRAAEIKVTHTKNTICPRQERKAIDIIHAEVCAMSYHYPRRTHVTCSVSGNELREPAKRSSAKERLAGLRFYWATRSFLWRVIVANCEHVRVLR